MRPPRRGTRCNASVSLLNNRSLTPNYSHSYTRKHKGVLK